MVLQTVFDHVSQMLYEPCLSEVGPTIQNIHCMVLCREEKPILEIVFLLFLNVIIQTAINC